jgi:hypothetical protein
LNNSAAGENVTRTFAVKKLRIESFPVEAVVSLSHPSINLNGSCVGYTQLGGWAKIASNVINVKEVGHISKCNNSAIQFVLQASKSGIVRQPLQAGQLLTGRGVGNPDNFESNLSASCFDIFRRIESVHQVFLFSFLFSFLFAYKLSIL